MGNERGGKLSGSKPAAAKPPLSMAEFQRVEMRAGTVLSAKINAKARAPAYILEVDFGPELGVKTTSAQLTERYAADELPGRQVVAVTNLPPLRVAGVKSEALVLAAVDDGGAALLTPDRRVANGRRIA